MNCLPAGYKAGTPLPSALATQLSSVENGLEPGDLYLLLTGGTGQKSGTPDLRVNYDGKTATTLPPGPYQLTNKVSATHPYPYDSYSASPVHRFMQMQQQLDCNAANAQKGVSFGCDSGLYAWVEETIGAGSNGAAQPANFTNQTTGEGSACARLLQYAAGRRALLQVARRHLLDERQLPPVGEGRHGRQPHHARHRRRDLLLQRRWQGGDAAATTPSIRRPPARRSRASPPR